MSDERNSVPTPEWQMRAEQLGDHDWRKMMEAATALARRAGRSRCRALGLAHPNAHVRRGCAGFLDQHATDACIPLLRWVALHDPADRSRRVAVHAVTCQQYKLAPLSGDLVGLLVQVALTDPQSTGTGESHRWAARLTTGRPRGRGSGADAAHRNRCAHTQPGAPRAQTAGSALQSVCRCRGPETRDRGGQRQEGVTPTTAIIPGAMSSEARVKRVDTRQRDLPY